MSDPAGTCASTHMGLALSMVVVHVGEMMCCAGKTDCIETGLRPEVTACQRWSVRSGAPSPAESVALEPRFDRHVIAPLSSAAICRPERFNGPGRRCAPVPPDRAGASLDGSAFQAEVRKRTFESKTKVEA